MKPDVVVYNVMIHVHVFIFGISLFRNQYRMSSGSEIERNLRGMSTFCILSVECMEAVVVLS